MVKERGNAIQWHPFNFVTQDPAIQRAQESGTVLLGELAGEKLLGPVIEPHQTPALVIGVAPQKLIEQACRNGQPGHFAVAEERRVEDSLGHSARLCWRRFRRSPGPVE